MAKNQRTVYLESDTLQYILDYQKEHNLSSFSVAIERIIFALMLGNESKTRIVEKPIKTDSKVVPQSIMNIRKTMGD